MRLFACLIFSCSLLIHSTVAQQWKELSSYDYLGKDDATCFRINNYAYLITGNNNGLDQANFLFQYSLEQNTWLRLKDFPGQKRQYAASFVLGENAYLLGGLNESGQALQDVWKYFPQTDEWIQLKDFPGGARWSMFSFALNSEGFVGTGTSGNVYFKDVWKFNAEKDIWLQMNDFPGKARRETAFLNIGEKAFVGLGFTFESALLTFDDFYMYNLLSDTWTAISPYPAGACMYAEGVGGASSGLLVGGFTSNSEFISSSYLLSKDGEWKAMMDFPLGGIRGTCGFSKDSEMYVLAGLKSDYSRSNQLFKLSLESNAIDFFLYPNPAQDEVVVVGSANSTVEVYDLLGRKHAEFQINEQGYGVLTNLKPGSYFLRNEKNETLRLQINR